jgi:hypothetical protein
MSWQTMSLEIAAQCPVPFPFAKTLVNRAWKDVQAKFLWSFLYGNCAIPTPVPVSTGSVTVAIGSNQVIGDADASAAWATFGLVMPITTRQFRVGQGTIYNIIAADFNVPAAAILTLDKPYVDPVAGAGTGYTVYGVFFNAPTKDFLWWESITDPVSGYPLKTTMTREFVDKVDPQRFMSGWPRAFIPYQVNSQPGNFFGYPMFEIWPAPLNNYTYVGSYFRKGMEFQNVTDTVFPTLGEDVVIELAKMYAYEWCEANRDKVPAAGARADFRYLMGATKKFYGELIDKYILQDSEYSHRHNISQGESEYWDMLPWVSEKTMSMYAP